MEFYQENTIITFAPTRDFRYAILAQNIPVISRENIVPSLNSAALLVPSLAAKIVHTFEPRYVQVSRN